MDAPGRPVLPPDPLVEAYKKHIDRTLLERNLTLTPTERLEQLQRFVAFLVELQNAPRRPGHADARQGH